MQKQVKTPIIVNSPVILPIVIPAMSPLLSPLPPVWLFTSVIFAFELPKKLFTIGAEVVGLGVVAAAGVVVVAKVAAVLSHGQ